MKRLILSLFTIIVFPTIGVCDILMIETNTWAKPKRLIWVCTLEKIDAISELAYFKYQNGENVDSFEVHTTRIYSLTLDNQDRVDKRFPVTREDLKTPLPTNPRSLRYLELSNRNFVVDNIPNDVRIRPDRNSIIIYLDGIIKTANLEKILIEARNARASSTINDTTSEFEIRRADLIKWIR